MPELTASQENYLETIFNLSQEGKVRVRDIADTAGVKLPSVTRAMNRLVEVGLVKHESYGVVEITKAGTQAGQAVIRRDKCLNHFLIDVLKLPKRIAEEEACRLEHVLGHDVLVRLEVLVEHAQQKNAKRWLQNLHEKLKSCKIEKKKNSVGTNHPHVKGKTK